MRCVGEEGGGWGDGVYVEGRARVPWFFWKCVIRFAEIALVVRRLTCAGLKFECGCIGFWLVSGFFWRRGGGRGWVRVEDRLVSDVQCVVGVVFVCYVEERNLLEGLSYWIFVALLQLLCAKLLVPDLPCCFRLFCAYTLAFFSCVLGSVTAFSFQQKVLVKKTDLSQNEQPNTHPRSIFLQTYTNLSLNPTTTVTDTA